MASPVISNFMKQQGFPDEPADACNMRFEGLYFQPRIVFPLILVGILLQSVWLFLALSAILWWNAFLPGLNPFEAVYNRHVALRRGTGPLTPVAAAPSDRRTGRPARADLRRVLHPAAGGSDPEGHRR